MVETNKEREMKNWVRKIEKKERKKEIEKQSRKERKKERKSEREKGMFIPRELRGK